MDNLLFIFSFGIIFSVFVLNVQNGTIRCRLPLCTCLFGFRAMVRQRPAIKVRSHSPEHPLPDHRPYPTPLLPFPTPQTPPVGGSSMTRGRPAPAPSCMHVSFVLFVSFFVLLSTFL